MLARSRYVAWHDSVRSRFLASPARPRNEVDGERIYFISNPALGLWAHKSRLGA